MIKLLNILVFNIICLFCFSQQKQINYYSRSFINDGLTDVLVFSIKQKANIYTIVYPSSNLSVIKSNENKEYYKDTSRYGPYKFSKKDNIIKFSYFQDNKWVVNDLYLLQLDTTFLIPNIYSSSPDSYNTKCILADSSFPIIIKNKKYYFYKFMQITSYDGSSLREVVYINKKNFLPYKIEYYADNSFKELYKIVESSNYK